jgi:hypothetical protein
MVMKTEAQLIEETKQQVLEITEWLSQELFDLASEQLGAYVRAVRPVVRAAGPQPWRYVRKVQGSVCASWCASFRRHCPERGYS